MKNEIVSFLMGVVIGAVLIMMISIIMESTPGNIRELKREAIERGHAEWIVNTNGINISPSVEFKWK
jgi:hypothetical protein